MPLSSQALEEFGSVAELVELTGKRDVKLDNKHCLLPLACFLCFTGQPFAVMVYVGR